MAFKLGDEDRSAIAHNGKIPLRDKMHPKVERTVMDDFGQAVSSNKIMVNKDLEKATKTYDEVMSHEMLHAKEMAEGRIDYGDDYVRDGDKVYLRKDGKIKYNGNWYDEGDDILPWEQRAIKAENYV